MKKSNIFLLINGLLAGHIIVNTTFGFYSKIIFWLLLGITIVSAMIFSEEETKKNETNNKNKSF